MTNKIKLFQNQKVRAEWDANKEEWWFSIVDVIIILTDAKNNLTGRKYWNKLKQRLLAEGNELVTNCHQLKFVAEDGKKRMTDVANTEQVLRIIQSIPSKKAEPFKIWLAKVGNQFIDEAVDPELAMNRAIGNYRRLGYSENWINQRLKTIEARKALTDEWDKSGVKQGKEYAILTDLMYKNWAGMKTREYKQHKGLKKENLRDNMTNTELVLNMLAEVAATDISIEEQPMSKEESAKIAKSGAEVAKNARLDLEKRTGKKAISTLNARTMSLKNALKDSSD